MTFPKGTRVRHPARPEWGLGQVLEDSKNGLVRIFFVDGDERNLKLDHVMPVIVTGPDATHVLLDNLGPKGKAFVDIASARATFLKLFPQGFYDPRFLEEERNYKVVAHELAMDLLAEPLLTGLLAGNQFAEICAHAVKVVAKTNLVFLQEQFQFKDSLKPEAAQKLFALSLVDHLYGKGPIHERFERFARTLEEVGALKWTTATYFLFIRYPEEYLFMKPFATLDSAERLRFEINYDSKPNWRTYEQVLKLAGHLRDNLADLRPRDLIDIQTFMWCIAEKRTKKGSSKKDPVAKP